MKAYIVEITDKSTGRNYISQDAFMSFPTAISFITNKREKVTVVSPWEYQSETTIYKIMDISVV